jgi:hypothetical protein
MRVSRQIGWSDKSNVLYDILQELEAISCKIACSNTTTTTTSTTTAPPVTCNTFVLINYSIIPQPYDLIDCNGNTVLGEVAEGQSLIVCAQSVNFGGGLFNVGGDSCNSVCTLYEINVDPNGEYSYTDCNGNLVGPIIEPSGGTFYVCANDVPSVTSGTVTALNLCQCISYTLADTAGLGGTYDYIGCDLVSYTGQTILPFDVAIVCSLNVPTVSLDVTITANSICIL